MINAPTNNGMMRCYNMFPGHFNDIDEMTTYLPYIQALGFNVVWVNPLQLAGQCVIEKANYQGCYATKLKSSIYAMADMTLIDPRFSLVKRDENGNLLLSDAQKEKALTQGYNLPSIEAINTLRNEIKIIKNIITKDTNSIPPEKEESGQDQKKKEYQSILEKQTKYKKNLTDLMKKQQQDASMPKADEEQATIKKKINALQKEINQFPAYIRKPQPLKIVQKIRLEIEKNNARLTQLQAELDIQLSIQNQFVQELDDAALKHFALTAQALGITPIFDLVLNHVSSDSSWINDPKFAHFFYHEDKTFGDVTAFVYAKLLGSDTTPPVTGEERENILNIIPTIIKEFWEPFLQKYILNYGFCGVRIDCVKKIPAEVRGPIYEKIKDYVNQSETFEGKPLILEESLFSKVSAEESIKIMQSVGATHNIASIYYKERQWHGGMEYNYNEEAGYKQLIVENGTINFTGNHDHYSCAMTVCRNLAHERFQENTELYNAYLACEPLNVHTSLYNQFLFFYTTQIIDELHRATADNQHLHRFGIAYRDKMLTSMLSGSGGYYVLSGDEYSSFHQPSCFINMDGSNVTPSKTLKIFSSEHAVLAYQVLDNMADQALRKKGRLGTQYQGLSLDNKKILRCHLIEKYKNDLIGGNNYIIQNAFKTDLQNAAKQKGISIDKTLYQDTTPITNNLYNKWSSPVALEKFSSKTFLSEVNNIIKKLPASKKGFWSELFKYGSEKKSAVDLFIAVRMNGMGYNVDTDVILFNMSPDNPITIQKDDIEKISTWLRKRGFGENPCTDNPDYHRAYGCIMGSEYTHQKPANLYFGGKIEIAPCVEKHAVLINGIPQPFNIVVAPNNQQEFSVDPISNTILVDDPPPTFIISSNNNSETETKEESNEPIWRRSFC